MPKFSDYVVNTDVQQMMEKIIENFPNDFQKFDTDSVHVVFTKGKPAKSKSKIYKLKGCKYPEDTLHEKTYCLEIADEDWKLLSDKQKYHLVHRVMISIPEEGFETESKEYGKLIKHDYDIYAKEYKVTNGVPNWLEDDTKLPDLFSFSTK